jgi:Bacterial pre-peptidase C-terminal domain
MQKFIGVVLGLLSILLIVSACNGTILPPSKCSISDANGEFASADEISLGQGVKGTICESGDKDYLKIITIEAGVLEIKLEPVPSAVSLNVDLYNSNRERVSYSGTGSQGQSRFLERLVSAGTYYFLLSGSGSSIEEYTFVVTLDTKDKSELNNTFSDATALTFGTSVTGTIRSEGDLDYFKVNVTEPGVIDMRLDPAPSDLAMAITLYNSNQERIKYNLLGKNGQSSFLELLVDIGTYYISLNSYTNTSSAKEYTFVVDLDTTDKNEINNTYSDATAILLGQSVKGTMRSEEDLDVFRVDVPSDGTLSINLEVPPTVSLTAYLDDSTQKNVTFALGNTGQNITLERAVTAGTYYVRLDNRLAAGSKDEYTLSLIIK